MELQRVREALVSGCPEENLLVRFARGGAGEAELGGLEAHLDGCDMCRRAVAAAASEQTLPSLPAAPALVPGMRVGRYEIERELGRGGMGVVYQARDVTLDRRVALKLLHARRDAASQARLLREAQVMAKLAHPNVVPVFELGDWSGDLYLVMELVAGLTLEAWLKGGKHARREVLKAFVDAGRGLAAAHSAGVVHRDFKPANVLMGLDGRARVTDFGLSRPGIAVALPPLASPLVTREGALVGTVAYMAPEQLDGKAADEKADQFSFCVALAEALSGSRPFVGESWSELARSMGGKPRLAGPIPSAVRRVLRRGLERAPAKRFASMTAFLDALERAQRPGWTGVVVTAVVALAIVAGITASQEQRRPVAPAPAAAAAVVPVMSAAVDIMEGTVVTFEMVQQRAMPELYVTSSVVKADAASYIIGHRLNVPVRKGDTLLWSQFERMPDKAPADDAIPADLPVTLALGDDLVITWPGLLDFSVGDEKVLTARSRGDQGVLITGVAAGKTTLELKTLDGAHALPVTVTPRQAPQAQLPVKPMLRDGDKLVEAKMQMEVREGDEASVIIAGIDRIAVGDPSVLDVTVYDKDELVMHGVNRGRTTVLVWVNGERRWAFTVKVVGRDVQHDLDAPDDVRPDVQAVMGAHVKEIGRCYEAQLPGHPSLAGRVILGFHVAPSGLVDDVTVKSSSTTGSDSASVSALATCVIQRLKTWSFPKSTDGYAVTYPVVFQTEPPAQAEPTRAPSAALKDALSQSDILQTVLTHKPALQRCVEAQRQREPGATGKLVLRWTVTPAGKVTDVSDVSAEPAKTALAGCLMAEVKTWAFPKHAVQGEPITFPFKF